jgi:adenylate kinase
VVPGGRLVVLGKQGAGKGTQCVRLSHHYVIPHISTGDMLRSAVKAGTGLGLEARTFMDAGELIPDEIVLKMVGERLDQDDTRTRGFVLDGFPRTVAQAKGLDELLHPAELDLAVDVEVPTELVLTRLASRRTCEDCGTIYSTALPPSVPWICDLCGGEVVQREDDTEDAIRRRLVLYETETAPLIAWYQSVDRLVQISGVGGPDEVFETIVDEIESRRNTGSFGPPIGLDGYHTHRIGQADEAYVSSSSGTDVSSSSAAGETDASSDAMSASETAASPDGPPPDAAEPATEGERAEMPPAQESATERGAEDSDVDEGSVSPDAEDTTEPDSPERRDT